MLKRKQRLSRREFQILLKKGVRIHNTNLSFVYLLTPNAQKNEEIVSRCGVVVSKKTAHKAPSRNKLRRRIYDVLREEYTSLPKGYCAVLTRPGAATLPYSELRAELSVLINKVAK